MKSFPRRAALLGAMFFFGVPFRAFAQRPSPLQIEVAQNGGDEKNRGARVVLRFPDNTELPTNRVRVGLYERGSGAKIGEIARRIEARQIAFTVSGEPGDYEVRVLADNRERTPLFAPQTLSLSGITRENGAWLLNGSPFIDEATSPENLNGAPLFVAGLQRDKIKGDGRRIIPLNARLAWRTLRVQLSLRDDDAAVRAALSAALQNASTRGERNLLGVEVSLRKGEIFSTDADSPVATTDDAGISPVADASDAARIFASLRRAMNQLTPTAALIFAVDAAPQSDASTRILAQVAALCDAIVIDAPPSDEKSSAALWAMKAARRVAETEPRYDLPIFARAASDTASPVLLDLWMSGATALILPENAGDQTAPLLRVLARNENLFAGGATLEDIGLWPAPASPDSTNFYATLRNAGRVPLLAMPRNASEKDVRVLAAESLMARFDQRISAASISRLEATANAGARIYFEGAPHQDESGKATTLWRLTKLLGFTGRPRGDGTARETITLDDAWTFGALRGLKISAARPVDVQLLLASATSQAKAQPGLDVLTAPRVVATYADGTPAMIVNPVGKGFVMWSPGGFAFKNKAEEAAFYRAGRGVGFAAASRNQKRGRSRQRIARRVAPFGARNRRAVSAQRRKRNARRRCFHRRRGGRRARFGERTRTATANRRLPQHRDNFDCAARPRAGRVRRHAQSVGRRTQRATPPRENQMKECASTRSLSYRIKGVGTQFLRVVNFPELGECDWPLVSLCVRPELVIAGEKQPFYRRGFQQFLEHSLNLRRVLVFEMQNLPPLCQKVARCISAVALLTQVVDAALQIIKVRLEQRRWRAVRHQFAFGVNPKRHR